MSIEEVEERGTGRVEESVPGNKLAVLQMGLGHNRDSNTKWKKQKKQYFCTCMETGPDANVENPNWDKPREPTDSELSTM